MATRRGWFLTLGLALTLGWIGLARAQAPDGQQAPVTVPGVIKSEANLVLVDVIATDKKDNYIRDLDAKEFHVFEDDNEQPITSFSHNSADASPQAPQQPRYIVLFFDNSTMNPADQTRARQAAAQFVEKGASKNRMMAVVDFTGAFRVTQNFTADSAALKRAVSGVKFASLQPNEPGQTTEVAQIGSPSMVQVRSDFAARSELIAIRNLAKTLRGIPGRKTLVFFSGGFPLTAERQSELTATIDAANKANIAIYAIDVRGLVSLPSITPGAMEPSPTQQRPGFPGLPPGAELEDSPFPQSDELLASRLPGLVLPQTVAQRPGGGGGGTGGGGGRSGGGGTGGGGTGGGTAGGGGGTAGGGGGTRGGGGTTGGGTSGGGGRGTTGGGTAGSGGRGTTGGSRGGGNPTFNPNNTRFGQPGYDIYQQRSIIPPLLDNVSTNQQILQQLAAGTGGLTILNTNDFLEGLNKITQELDENYILGYVPPNPSHEGGCHRIQVRVDRKGVKTRFRSGYCDVRGSDLLAGRPEGKTLEERAAAPQPGEIPVALSAPYFYTEPNVARVNLSMEVPGQMLPFEKQKGKFHSVVNILGIAYREDGGVAARFSDSVKLDLEKGEQKELAKGSFSYQNNFNIAPGKYTFKVVMGTSGQKFGKYETPLVIEPFDGKKFYLSGVALSNKMQPVSELTAGLDAALLEERTPLIVKGVEVSPSPDNRFTKKDKVGLYVEVYEPLLLAPNPPRVGILYDIVDLKTNQQVHSSNTILVEDFIQAGNPVIPVGVLLPVETLQAGNYRLEVKARDGVGNVSPQHSVEFAVE